jgi:radical SAM protein with 4Fe4S-binding SPASM domain
MIETSSLPGPFHLDLPEVYQIELSSACNLNCTMCPRKLMPRENQVSFIPIELIQKMIQKGDLDRSYFVEFQMSGEPLLHPHLDWIVNVLKTCKPDLLLGLSTNGLKIPQHLETLRKLDYITISVDSLSDYESIRVGGKGVELVSNIALLLNSLDLNKTTVDLQLIELEGWEEELRTVQEIFGKYKVNIRTVPDCFLTMFDTPTEVPVKREICINPWLSVSIQSNGNVVPCCFCFGDDNILGNVHKNSLREIWQGDEVRRLRETFMTGAYRKICSKCYMRSPALLHWEIFMKSIKGK